MRILILLLTTALLVTGIVDMAAAQSNCTTTRNPLTGALDTRCSDGSSSTSTQNPLTGQWDTTIRPGPPQPYSTQPYQSFPQPRQQHCTTTRNPLTGALQTTCY